MNSDSDSSDPAEDSQSLPGCPPLPGPVPAVNEAFNSATMYANKGRYHTIEHVYNRYVKPYRVAHYKDCILDCGTEAEATLLAEAEAQDCLSTVSLSLICKSWGTRMTERQLEALDEGQGTQVQENEGYQWELDCSDEEARQLLHHLLRENLEKLYNRKDYREEAVRRLSAVLYVVDRIPRDEQKRIMDRDVLYKLMLAKLISDTGDSRTKLLKKVALFHWFMKTDLSGRLFVPFL